MSKKVIAKLSPENNPISALILNAFLGECGFKWQTVKSVESAELLFLPDNDVLKGETLVAKYIARLLPGFHGTDAYTATEIDQWVEYAGTIPTSTEEDLISKILTTLDEHLRMRTYFTGHSFTLADVAVYAGLLRHEAWRVILTTNKKLKYRYLVRWYQYCESYPQFASVSSSFQPVDKKDRITATFSELPGAQKGKVVTRFPPEPSGFLHIGHAKAAFMNNYYAKRYEGKLIIRFDDTNPRKEKDEFEDAIIEDLKTMEVVGDKVSHTSDYFDEILAKAEALIKAGKAYCDPTPAEEVSKLRDEMKPSPYRDSSVEETLKNWEAMKNGTPEGLKMSLRAKIDYKSVNGTMRDPVIYRCVLDAHHRTGTKYKVYPIYNFSCPVVDSLEGVTHALRSNEYHDSEEQYAWFLKNIPGLNHVHIKDFSRVNFTHTVLSKRKLQWIVDKGFVDGWNDPRFPTIQGVVRRGLKTEALRKFIYDLGDSVNTVNMEIHKLWAENKKLIDRIIPRYTAIRKENAVVVSLDGPEKPEVVEVPRHKQNPDLGKKTITRCNKIYLEQVDAALLKDDTEVTLMDWGNVIITKVVRDDKGVVTSIDAKLNLAGDFKKTEYKLTWLPAIPEVKLSDINLIEYDNIISAPKIPKGSEFHEFVNINSKRESAAFGDAALTSLPKGTSLQFERLGYYVLDCDPSTANGKPLNFVDTPDGHKKNVFLSKKTTSE
eukprot:TRINITY_DN2177_c0_g1_i1.p1 TRINITY_DN2177_c0_g1~~TRINITY_DN2177_c0_g1_i1.p1  ORF type:complete len:716 (-),score=203.18 TRINITY_DN2177_c0_g1_i1:35-2182(-)